MSVVEQGAAHDWSDFIDVLRDAMLDAEEDGPEYKGHIELRIDGEWHQVKDGHVDVFSGSDWIGNFLQFTTGTRLTIVDARRIDAIRWVAPNA